MSELQSGLKRKTVALVEVSNGAEAEGHIPGARVIPEAEMVERAKSFPKYRQIVLYCHGDEQEAGIRAASALQADDGALNVAVLEGGYEAWRKAGLPVKRGR